jgi:hypothetical protein
MRNTSDVDAGIFIPSDETEWVRFMLVIGIEKLKHDRYMKRRLLYYNTNNLSKNHSVRARQLSSPFSWDILCE